MLLSNSNLMVTLPSGNKAVYSVQPQHIPREEIPESYRWPIDYGQQIAHELDGKWFKPGAWEEITDLKIIALLERCPEV